MAQTASFSNGGGKLDGAGSTLEDMQMVTTADPDVQGFAFQNAQPWTSGIRMPASTPLSAIR
jgi:hypothetical protein